MSEPFTVLTVGGSDPVGGAGIQGDLKTFCAHGVYGTAVVAALTAQNAAGLRGVQEVDPAFVALQIEAVYGQIPPRAVKCGMLLAPAVVGVVAEALAPRHPRLVVDPVLKATAGGSLARRGLLEALGEALLPLATVATPNLDEAAAFLGRPVVAGEEGDAAAALRALWRCEAVLLKGGHGRGSTSVDHLASSAGVRSFSLPRVSTVHGHGGGCALSAALAVRLGRGEPIPAAVEGAKAYVHRALAGAQALGSGRGPVKHDVPIDS